MTATPTGEEDGLARLRDELDRIDLRFLAAVRDRIECCVRIADHKREHAVPMMQPHRIDAVQRRAAEFGAENGVSEAFLSRLYDLMIEETCRVETLVIEQGSPDGESASGASR
ncbi:chorismate mutase family protein [Amycolatopsis sp. PS_44_ISF1]|uniref:chorismate mutase family protein n=1 Tax=Amycolatopsis sp. PS_44_ISF1 TaxID=2974917 RepID=UPI0028DFD285|nr:chorismate mutase family protein [Amycolatopsis sp. PS_44_ISF1]MDT8912419.1 chorismate mutase family protein [Amycolatopsis sp. PS_44_ISF1]